MAPAWPGPRWQSNLSPRWGGIVISTKVGHPAPLLRKASQSARPPASQVRMRLTTSHSATSMGGVPVGSARMHDRLNFFEPWERPANHENQLTRALLVVLRYCPIAHQAWLSLLDAASGPTSDDKLPKLTLHSLPRPTFDTQRAQILGADGQPQTNEPIRGISVLCSADATNDVPAVVLESDRGQVLDGIVRYGDDLVIVLESKLQEMVDDNQARNINLYGQPITLDSPLRKISWRNVLASFTDLADQNRGLISGAEREILNDFLALLLMQTFRNWGHLTRWRAVQQNHPAFGAGIAVRFCAAGFSAAVVQLGDPNSTPQHLLVQGARSPKPDAFACPAVVKKETARSLPRRSFRLGYYRLNWRCKKTQFPHHQCRPAKFCNELCSHPLDKWMR